MRKRASDGASTQAHYEAAARQGSASALRELEEIPDCPPEMQYLVDWLDLLCGRSGMGLDGPAPLSYATIESWERKLKIEELEPHEVLALILLDTVIRHPEEHEEDNEEADEEEAAPVLSHAWPQRKPGVEPQFVKEEI